MKRRELTTKEKQWQQNLNRLYHSRKKDLRLTQDTVAELCGWNTQASVSNYMTGVIPLNTDAKIKLANALKIDVREIDPEFSLAPITQDTGNIGTSTAVINELTVYSKIEDSIEELSAQELSKLIAKLATKMVEKLGRNEAT